MIEIEKNIPIPEKIGGHPTRYPLKVMEIGDSFFVECPDDKKKKLVISIDGCGRRYKPKRFTSRSIDGGVRCWRIE